MQKVKIIRLLGNGAQEMFLETDKGTLLCPVSKDEAEELFGSMVNPEDFGGVAEE